MTKKFLGNIKKYSIHVPRCDYSPVCEVSDARAAGQDTAPAWHRHSDVLHPTRGLDALQVTNKLYQSIIYLHQCFSSVLV